ncbi:MAG: zinc ribbon domain-containing protein [Firmicutes bacterium]|nr:zinc ribbon domain-containing protein [Bacillota bacterium]
MGTLWDVLKDKLSSAKDGAEKFAKIAIDKTTNVVDITKLNLAKSEADSKINKLYAKVGETIYEQYKNGEEFDKDLCEIMIEIDKFKAESEELKEQIAALKSTAACPECGQQNDKSSEYCSKCGAKLAEDSEEEDKSVDIVSEDE